MVIIINSDPERLKHKRKKNLIMKANELQSIQTVYSERLCFIGALSLT